MMRRGLNLGIVLGLALAYLSQSQAVGQTSAKPSNDCEETTAAYNNQVNACNDYRQHLNDLRVRIDALRKQQAEDLERCKNMKPADRSACESLAELEAGQLSIQEQNYTTFAQQGCPAPTVGPAQIKNACSSSVNGAKTSTKRGNQDLTGGAASTGKNPSVSVSKARDQVPRTDSGAHAQQPRVSPSGMSGGNGSFSGQGRIGAAAGGPPAMPSAPAAAPATAPKQK